MADTDSIIGTWQLVSSVKEGIEMPAETVAQIRVVIGPSSHTVYFGDQVVTHEIPYICDPTVDPKTTSDTLPDGRHIHGICLLDGDTLTSCVAEVDEPRPTSFASPPGSGHTLRVFRRVG